MDSHHSATSVMSPSMRSSVRARLATSWLHSADHFLAGPSPMRCCGGEIAPLGRVREPPLGSDRWAVLSRCEGQHHDPFGGGCEEGFAPG